MKVACRLKAGNGHYHKENENGEGHLKDFEDGQSRIQLGAGHIAKRTQITERHIELLKERRKNAVNVGILLVSRVVKY